MESTDSSSSSPLLYALLHDDAMAKQPVAYSGGSAGLEDWPDFCWQLSLVRHSCACSLLHYSATHLACITDETYTVNLD